MNRTIIAVDPGPTESALVSWSVSDQRILFHHKGTNEEIRKLLSIENTGYAILAIEMIESYGMRVGKEVFETCLWIGRYCQYVEPKIMYRIGRRHVKLAICADSRAKDADIRRALVDLLGAPGTKKAQGPTYGIAGDEWQALGLAITVQRLMEEGRLEQSAIF